MTLGEKIRNLRKEKNWTQAELAEKLFVTRQAITNYERNANRPDYEIIKKLSEVFEIDINYLLFDEDEIKKSNEEEVTAKPSEEDEVTKLDDVESGEKKKFKKKRKIVLILSSVVLAIVFGIFIVYSIIEDREHQKKVESIEAGWYITFDFYEIMTIDELSKSDVPYSYNIYDDKGRESGIKRQNYLLNNILYFSNKYNEIYVYVLYYYPYYKEYKAVSIDTNCANRYKELKILSDTIYISPVVKEVNIISYDKYHNVLFEDKIYLDFDNLVRSKGGQLFGDRLTLYNYDEATSYYVELIYESWKERFNILEQTSIYIFMSDGDYHNTNSYDVTFML